MWLAFHEVRNELNIALQTMSQAYLIICSVEDTIVLTNEDITKGPKIRVEEHVLEATCAITLELKEKFKYWMNLNGLTRGPLQSKGKLTFPPSPVPVECSLSMLE
ncbi:hypothetical protein E2320_020738 [Naja naja]|nr:hypothetical protein E2320_020738 [Naja naja]